MLRRTGDHGTNSFSRADRHRGLRDDDHFSREVLANRFGNGEDVPEIGGAIFVGRRSNGDEDDFGAADRARNVGREEKPSLGLIPFDEDLEPRLVDRYSILTQRADLVGVHVRTRDVVAGLRETRSDDEPDIPRPYDRNAHRKPLSRQLRRPSPANLSVCRNANEPPEVATWRLSGDLRPTPKILCRNRQLPAVVGKLFMPILPAATVEHSFLRSRSDKNAGNGWAGMSPASQQRETPPRLFLLNIASARASPIAKPAARW